MTKPAMPAAMILCGGQGTRLRDANETLPKPMVPIGSQPIVWHIMRTYAGFGVRRFILLLGYKREAFIDYFLNYAARRCDITVKLGSRNNVVYHGSNLEEDWEVTLADTGEATYTSTRVVRGMRYVGPDEENVFLTYGDGVSDVNIRALLAHHHDHERCLTVTAVHPIGRFGEMQVAGSQVTGFHEKPQTESGLINGGFMVLRRAFIDRYLSPDPEAMLEQEPMRRAAQDDQMSAFVHDGFWQCMDTLREHILLTQLWESGKAPWTVHW